MAKNRMKSVTPSRGAGLSDYFFLNNIPICQLIRVSYNDTRPKLKRPSSRFPQRTPEDGAASPRDWTWGQDDDMGRGDSSSY